MNLGAFAVVIAVARKTRSGEISSYGGLFEYAPGAGRAMTIFLFSLAGIPPLGGWFAKFVVFRALLDAGGGWAVVLGVIGAVNSVIALFYYAAVAREMWMKPGARRRRHARSGCRSRSARRWASPPWPRCVDRRPAQRRAALRRADHTGAGRKLTTADDARRARLADRIARARPDPLRRVHRAALYDPAGGFYAAGGAGRAAGRLPHQPRGRPAVRRGGGPRPRRLVGRARPPDPFVVVEAGAGPGTLARTVLAAGPACARRCATCSSSVGGPAGAARGAPPARAGREAFAGVGADETTSPPPARHRAGRVSLAELPAVPVHGVVLANELLDNLPFAPVRATASGWHEVRVGADGRPFVEVLVPARPTIATPLPVAPERAPGPASRCRRRRGVAGATPSTGSSRGRLVVIDYAAATAELAARPWREWLRTYRGHDRGGHSARRARAPRTSPCDVALDQLAAVRGARRRALPGRVPRAPRHRRAGGRGPADAGPSGPPSATSPPEGPQPGPRGRGAHRPGRPRRLHGGGVGGVRARRPYCDNPCVTCSALPRPAAARLSSRERWCAVGEADRHRLDACLARPSRPRGAAFLVEHLPSVGWVELATLRVLYALAALSNRDLDGRRCTGPSPSSSSRERCSGSPWRRCRPRSGWRWPGYSSIVASAARHYRSSSSR